MKLAGEIEGKDYVNYRPFSKDGPVGPPTAQPLGNDKDHAPAAQKPPPGSPGGPGPPGGGGGGGGPPSPGGPRDPG
eukprot:2837835-Pyramimonas_sp.AAC.1